MSKAKEKIKKAGMMTASDCKDALDGVLDNAISAACARAKANGRKTVRATDF
ncbi:MAG: hypothetical protein P1V18_04200 [Candidatus Gracilibacteria bacterium]|nr:hypothetical protein [Candidatus Gracilibacteria bacterium]